MWGVVFIAIAPTAAPTLSPAGDELTVEFTKAAIDAEQIGSDDIIDFLGVSFSATDYIGHFFGPSSLESEDNILRLDRTLAKLFACIDEKIGLENTLIVLSADHGGPEAPGYLKSLGIPTGYVSPDSWDKQPAIDRIKSKFGVSGKLIEGYDHPYLYLSNEVISNSEVDLLALELAIVDELVRFPGVSTAVSSTALARGVVVDNYLTQAITNNYHPKRSGNVYVVFDPGWFINDLDGLSAAVVHGSPWPYDTFVPIIFAGHKLQPQTVSRRVHTVTLRSPSRISSVPNHRPGLVEKCFWKSSSSRENLNLQDRYNHVRGLWNVFRGNIML